MSDGDPAPGPLGEARRRAYLEAMGIPVWVPRDAPGEPAGTAPAGTAPVPEPATGQAAVPESGTPVERPAATGPEGGEEPPPFPAGLADELAGQGAGAGDAAPDPAAGPAGAGAPDVGAMDRDTLRAAILGCTACELCQTRTQAVPGVGHAHADLLVIGEAPGQEEDRRGEPFVGRAGQLLDRMLAAIGLDRDTVFITNVLKCRPPKNRDPKPEEVRACAGYLRRQIELISPRAILSVGRISAQSLLETGDSIGRLRGRWHRFGPQGTPLLVTYHPAYLLRSPVDKRKAWADLKAVRERLRGVSE